MRDDRERLLDIQEAIADIDKYAQRGRNAFQADELIQNWIIHHLLILGEAASRISEDFKEKHPNILWSKMIGLRNVLIHNYFGIDMDLVWSVVEKDLPELQRQIEELFR